MGKDRSVSYPVAARVNIFYLLYGHVLERENH
jgi:hypothetical protein